MAYDVYWTGYDYVMDIEALEAIGIAKVNKIAENKYNRKISLCCCLFSKTTRRNFGQSNLKTRT